MGNSQQMLKEGQQHLLSGRMTITSADSCNPSLWQLRKNLEADCFLEARAACRTINLLAVRTYKVSSVPRRTADTTAARGELRQGYYLTGAAEQIGA